MAPRRRSSAYRREPPDLTTPAPALSRYSTAARIWGRSTQATRVRRANLMRRPAGLGQPRRPPRRCEPYRSHNARNGIVVSTDRSVSSRPMSAIALLNLASATFQAHRRPRPASAHPRFGLSVKQDVAICARPTAAASAAPPGQSASEAAAGQLSRLLAGLPAPRISRLLRLQPLDLHPQSHHQQPASGPLKRDIVAYDTLVSVVSPFHRPRPVGEERRTMILPCTGS